MRYKTSSLKNGTSLKLTKFTRIGRNPYMNNFQTHIRISSFFRADSKVSAMSNSTSPRKRLRKVEMTIKQKCLNWMQKRYSWKRFQTQISISTFFRAHSINYLLYYRGVRDLITPLTSINKIQERITIAVRAFVRRLNMNTTKPSAGRVANIAKDVLLSRLRS
jgi:hypothetical protein